MKIGLIDIEPKIYNTALMQISQHHKDRGDTVEWAAPLEYDKYDYLYCSSLFTYTDKSQVPQRAICGGTGFNLSSRLSQQMEASDLDYSIYPKCKTSYIWFSRGCNRKCPWCVVPEKEGNIHCVNPKNLNPASQYIAVCDNNFLENPRVGISFYKLHKWNLPVDIQQGIDIRTIGGVEPEELAQLKHYKQIKIAWDNPTDEKSVLAGIGKLTHCIPAYKIMCYVLIGYYDDPQGDLHRVETLRSLKIDPFVMPFNKFDPYQKKFARWVNHKAIFKTVKWKDYKKGTRCTPTQKQ